MNECHRKTVAVKFCNIPVSKVPC